MNQGKLIESIRHLLMVLGLFLVFAGAAFAMENRDVIGPWLMDLQLGDSGFGDPSELTPEQRAELAEAPPEIKEMVEKVQRHFKAVRELKQIGPNAVPPLLDLLRHSKDLKVKDQALVAIDHLQPRPESVIGPLAEYLNTGESAENAALVLARQGPQALDPLLAARTNRNSAVRAAVAWHLTNFRPNENRDLRITINGDERKWPNFKPQDELISGALLELLEDDDLTVRLRAAGSLGDWAPQAAKVVPALVRHLEDVSPAVRGNAASALAQYGEAARPVVHRLVRSLYDPDENVRAAAAIALKAVGEHSRKPPLIALDPDKIQFTPTRRCYFLQTPDGMALSGNGHLITQQQFAVPVVIRARAKTDSTNIRLYYGQGMIILNWERNPRELRIHDPLTGKPSPVANAGFVEANTWHDIEWAISKDGMEILVDGVRRAKMNGDYAGIRGTVGIGGANGSSITVKEISAK